MTHRPISVTKSPNMNSLTFSVIAIGAAMHEHGATGQLRLLEDLRQFIDRQASEIQRREPCPKRPRRHLARLNVVPRSERSGRILFSQIADGAQHCVSG